MPILKFLCPTTQTYFDSGIRVDERSAAASRLNIVRVRCAECRREHRFLLADGVLDGPDALSKKSARKGSSPKIPLPWAIAAPDAKPI
jgi:hypothetical protein